MSGVATAVAVGSAVSAYSADKAADQAASSSDDALQLQYQQYQQQRKDQKPWLNRGRNALRQLNNKKTGIGSFEFDLQSDPGYQFARDEALTATDRNRRAGGFGNSGNILAALTDRAGGIASQYTDNAFNRQFSQYQDELNRWQAMAGLGQSATSQVGNAGNVLSGAYGQNGANQANAGYYQAAGLNNAVQGGINNYLTYDYLNGNQPQQYTGGGSAYNPNNNFGGNR